MKKYILTLFFMLLFAQIVSSDIISVNSGGSNEYVTIPETITEGFFFGQISPVGGGTPSSRGLPPLNYELCNYTYQYIQDYGQNNTDHITDYINLIFNETNKVYSWSNIQTYILNWQFYCSDFLNKSLSEDYVCSEVKSFSNLRNNYSESDIEQLRNKISQELPISTNLLKYYLINVDSLCKQESVINTLLIFPKSHPLPVFLLLLILFMFVLFFVYSRKKKMIIPLLLTIRKKRETRH